MKKITFLLFGFLAIHSAFAQQTIPAAFSEKIARYGLEFKFPADWVSTPVIKNPVMPYDFAVRIKSHYEDNYCEIRYLILPPGKDRATFMADAKTKILLPLFDAHESFIKLNSDEGDLMNKADWLTSFGSTQYDEFSFKKEFAQSYTDGNVVVMEKKGKARIVVMILRNKADYSCDDLSPELFYSLIFK